MHVGNSHTKGGKANNGGTTHPHRLVPRSARDCKRLFGWMSKIEKAPKVYADQPNHDIQRTFTITYINIL